MGRNGECGELGMDWIENSGTDLDVPSTSPYTFQTLTQL